jgi:beta-phosphoglucomutase
MLVRGPIEAIIFDFDGVLADSEVFHCVAFEAVAAAAGLPFSRAAYFERLLGLPDSECLAALCAEAGVACDPARLKALVAQKRAAFARLAGKLVLYPGVETVLRSLHGHFQLAIASGAFRDEIEPLLTRAGVRGLFAAVIGADDVQAGKPDPEPLARALAALNARANRAIVPAACVVVEDAPVGVAAARAAGMQCIAVTTHHERAALSAADATISSVAMLRREDLQA